MNRPPLPQSGEPKPGARRELMSCVRAVALALLLTVVPFALVHWQVAGRSALLALIGVCALVQAAVHFRLFLHLGRKPRREDLQLVLFSVALLVIMVAGTIWVMGNLAARMMPMAQ
ncbi:cytochrome o ubiquinol/quinol oxidase subunit IV [Comamonas sp. NLF-1-9]|uniref:cytochrome o ubiquinol oxidase subunit IV n=1 Tax=Comamonas sp. NLF-1-9 TaxID=2853163 RepID=UPI001C455DD7|nr:cytochrome C oxidase subunit IV family protein [Comamonas sp. NLF-1-9]QXL84161.1 cytochrome C oxidase subunit IV family protein [Comamonas sp. NLF-1-9]